jgi:ankyrin repeat protein
MPKYRGSMHHAHGPIVWYYLQRTPLAKACYFGHLEVVHFLLERGADVKPKALEDAIKEGYE